MTARILIVEDNADNTKLLMRLLTAEGFRGETVETAEQALVRIEEEHFDCVLMDILLPGMDGKDATRRLRADPRFRTLPIIAVTAQAIDSERKAIMAAGVSAIVTKPIDFDELSARLGEVLATATASNTPGDPPRVAPPATYDNGTPAASGPSILIVEDNPENTKLLIRMLTEEGLHGEAVETAEAGLLRLEQQRFDLVLMDVRLPGLDGKDAVRQLRANPRFRNLPIIAVSAYVASGELQAILESGVSAIVSKPIDRAELLHAIRALLPTEELHA